MSGPFEGVVAQLTADFLSQISTSPFVIFFLVNLILFLLGWIRI